MVIARTFVMKNSDRTKVLVIGNYPIDKGPFEQRRLTPTPIQFEQLGDVDITNSACGVLLSPFPGKYALIHTYFEEHFCKVCELGLMSTIYTTGKIAQISEIRDKAYSEHELFKDIIDVEKRKQSLDSLPWVYINESAWAIAETLARHDPGPPVKENLQIYENGITEPLAEETKTILKRAFYDSDRITVERLEGGKTAKETLRVFAIKTGPESGPQPMPFFVKLGSFRDIEEESINYRMRVEPFIPFHLRPSLIESRSLRTLKYAALVCNFVESAISLRDALRTGQADCSIFSLFEVTLRGLRGHTLKAQKIAGVIANFFNPRDGRVKTYEIYEQWAQRIEQLHINYPTARDPKIVEDILRNLAANIETREGIYHGDLHAGNVMVRNRDAIVIDFGSMRPFGPLSADPSILEVSLVFGTDNHDDPKSFDAWRDFVEYIFHDPLIPPLPKADHHPFAWLHRAIRELRHVVSCCGVEKDEVQIILAGCLLRFGRLTPHQLQRPELMELAEKRRVYALVVADNICRKLEKDHAARE